MVGKLLCTCICATSGSNCHTAWSHIGPWDRMRGCSSPRLRPLSPQKEVRDAWPDPRLPTQFVWKTVAHWWQIVCSVFVLMYTYASFMVVTNTDIDIRHLLHPPLSISTDAGAR